MHFVWKFLIHAVANAAGLWAADRFVPGFEVLPRAFFELRTAAVSLAIAPMIQTLAAGGIAFAIANAMPRPVLKVVGALLPLITFAILSVAWNALLLFTADSLLDSIVIADWRTLGWASLIMGFLNALF